MPDNFDKQSPPFDRLDAAQQTKLEASLDVAYYRNGDKLITANDEQNALFIMLKGTVEERDESEEEVFAHYGNDDLFDLRAMFEPTAKHHYVALEDTLVYLLPKELFVEFYQQNGEFAAYFDNNLAKRQALIEEAQQQKNIAEFILTQVDDSIYSPPVLLSASTPLDQVSQTLKQQGVDSALVELDETDPRLSVHPHAHPYAIITRTNMLHALTLDRLPLDVEIGKIATFPVVHVDVGEFLFNAMVLMTRQRMKRLMVCDGNQAVGMLDMTQILSTFSTHSHVLTLAIARANTIDELALASNKQKQLVDSLLSRGIRTRFIMELISAVNEQIIEKAFELVVPPALHDQICLVVLGSEGRGEQILKTDQDNALIIKDGLEWHQCGMIMEQLSQTLLKLGYPPCPGKVMVNNEFWVRNESAWKNTLAKWISSAQPTDAMNLSIFADAHAVAGDKSMLETVLAPTQKKLKGNLLMLQEFVRPALQFSVPLTLFGNVKKNKQGLDLKKGGIFPIVHGVRTLALEYGIAARNTFDRIEALQQKNVLEPDTADNLSEAFKLLTKLRLAQQMDPEHSDSLVHTEHLERTERDLLRHALHVVKKFKQLLGFHYQIRD
jgi:CBS domain-containing protein